MEMSDLIKKINELAHKQKTVGLSEEEKQEQAGLRQDYLKIFRSNFKSQLEHTKIQTPDGNLHPLRYMPNDDKKPN
ncbi:MAG: hypothetical protein K0S71_398 [Clostridia bacterium]|jgi:uncharacterized protein YnzC (UPF0291/DUF896 family)|nr:hypothetical protein [Clostridia bacterium]